MLYRNTDELEQRIMEHTVAQTGYCEFADVSIAELVCAVKISSSFKQVHYNEEGTPITEYINERNYYGYRPFLMSNSILLFLYLHFLHPSSDGKVTLYTREAAEFLGMSPKSVRHNLKSLSSRQYIIYAPGTVKGSFDVVISSFATKHLPASQGGKGYVSIPFSVFSGMLAPEHRAKNINELRMQIRGFLFSCPGKASGRFKDVSIDNIKQNFPSYITRKDIRHILVQDSIRDFFTVSFASGGNSCSIIARDEFNFTKIKEQTIATAETAIRSEVNAFLSRKKYASLGFTFSASDFSDIARICLKFPLQDVISGIHTLFTSYRARDVRGGLGALIRVLTEDRYYSRVYV